MGSRGAHTAHATHQEEEKRSVKGNILESEFSICEEQ